MADFDVIVVGVGTCGEDLSLRMLDSGLSVAGVESNLVGGECPYWACIPSKRMIRMGNLIAEARRADGLAGTATVIPDWSLVAGQIREEVTGGWDDSVGVGRFGDRGGTLFKGEGRLTGPKRVVVGDDLLTARLGVVVATGSRPALPPIPGLAEAPYWTTRDVIECSELPESLAILGGGAVGCELGQLLARFGVTVSIIEAGPRLMAGEEPEASAVVAAALEEDGVTLRTGGAAEQILHSSAGFEILISGGEPVGADRLLVATGRRCDLSELGLESVGLDPAALCIEVDDRMRAAEGLWAIGDVTGKTMMTHVALHQANIAFADITGAAVPAPSYHAIPRVTFTDPEVGAVGLTAAQAMEAGVEAVVTTKTLQATFRGWLHRIGAEGLIKLVVDGQSGTLVGATSVGPHGGEVLGMLTLAVQARLPMAELQRMIYAFPTFHGAVGEAIGAYGRGVGTVLDPGYDLGEIDAAAGLA